jgi:hypothetical protein
MPVRRTRTVVAAGAALALLLAGCSDDGEDGGGGRPTVDELSAELASDGGLSQDQAECVARAFVESDVSDEGLRSILDAGDVSGSQADLDAADQAAVGQAAQGALACASQGIVDELEDSTTSAPGETTTTAAG